MAYKDGEEENLIDEKEQDNRKDGLRALQEPAEVYHFLGLKVTKVKESALRRLLHNIFMVAKGKLNLRIGT